MAAAESGGTARGIAAVGGVEAYVDAKAKERMAQGRFAAVMKFERDGADVLRRMTYRGKGGWSWDVTSARVRHGKEQLLAHAALLGKIRKRFGVADEILVAIWGLETDFGENQGSTPSLDALATLAYDCRRSERFRGELLSALRIVERGDLAPEDMRGAWAGELGQTQFLPSSYERFGFDFDEDGKVDLVRSVEDALASTASYLAGHGWRAGEGYAPDSPNFEVLAEWNKSDVYRRTIVLFDSKLASNRR